MTSSRPVATPKDEWTSHLAIRAAWLSFVGGRTQGEIAKQLGVSAAKVHRLISYAQNAGYIKFQVNQRPLECIQIEEALRKRFQLNSCIIAPDLCSDAHDESIKSVASAAAQMLEGILSSSEVKQVGVGMGRTIKAAVEVMPQINRPDLVITSICGSLTRKLAANPFDVVQLLQERTGGEGYYLPVPYFAETPEEKDAFLGHRSVQNLLGKARDSDVFVVGIGSMEAEGHLVERGMISCAEQDELQKNGAVCDLMGRFLTESGDIAPAQLGDCAVGLHFNEVKGARLVALVGGTGKLEATLAALYTGVITDLVTDEFLARALCDKIGLNWHERP